MRIIKLLMGIGLQIIEMSGIEARRFAIGRFYATAIKLSSLGVVSTYYSRNFRKNCLDSYKVSLIFGFVFLCSLYFSWIGLLQLSRNVESNPGPTYSIEKEIQGSFHQGNPRFGKNCSCAVRLQFFVCIMLVASKDSVKVEQKWFKWCFNRRRFIIQSNLCITTNWGRSFCGRYGQVVAVKKTCV